MTRRGVKDPLPIMEPLVIELADVGHYGPALRVAIMTLRERAARLRSMRAFTDAALALEAADDVVDLVVALGLRDAVTPKGEDLRHGPRPRGVS